MAANRVEKAPGGAEVPAVVAAARDGDEAAFCAPRASSARAARCTATGCWAPSRDSGGSRPGDVSACVAGASDLRGRSSFRAWLYPDRDERLPRRAGAAPARPGFHRRRAASRGSLAAAVPGRSPARSRVARRRARRQGRREGDDRACLHRGHPAPAAGQRVALIARDVLELVDGRRRKGSSTSAWRR